MQLLGRSSTLARILRVFTTWVSLISATSKLDIIDINFGLSSERFGKFTIHPAVSRPGILVRLGAFVWHFGQALRQIPGSNLHRYPKASYMFCFASLNQKNTLEPIAKHTPTASLVGFDYFDRLSMVGAQRFPVALTFVCSVFFLPHVLLSYWRSTGYLRKSFRFTIDVYLLSYGCYLVSRLWLRRIKPRAVIVADDHGGLIRALVCAAKAEGVPTVYLQHASVSDKFPPLMFDYALLEGRDSLQKYDQAGPSQTKVFLIGMPKADSFYQNRNMNAVVQTIGICTNALDPLPRVDALCAFLHDAFPALTLILRPHPADRRYNIWKDMAQTYGLELSQSQTESSFGFLQRVDCIIAGDSNILLEAALLDVYPICYDFTEQHLDWYGFHRNGLAKFCTTVNEAFDVIEVISHQKPSVRIKAKIYCDTVGSIYDGRSAELAADIIRLLADGRSCEADMWRPIKGMNLEAYELVEGSQETLAGAA